MSNVEVGDEEFLYGMWRTEGHLNIFLVSLMMA